MSEDVPTYGEAIMNAVGAEAQAVLAFMADVQKMRALSAELAAAHPELAAETRKLNLQIARGQFGNIRCCAYRYSATLHRFE